jgi:circadian clock protein KaiB
MTAMQLRLYVAGEGPNSRLARENLRRILAEHASDPVEVEVVDCMRHPKRALNDGVLVTPTLVRLDPGPVQTIIGTLSDRQRVVSALGLPDLRDADKTPPARSVEWTGDIAASEASR